MTASVCSVPVCRGTAMPTATTTTAARPIQNACASVVHHRWRTVQARMLSLMALQESIISISANHMNNNKCISRQTFTTFAHTKTYFRPPVSIRACTTFSLDKHLHLIYARILHGRPNKLIAPCEHTTHGRLALNTLPPKYTTIQGSNNNNST